MRARTELLGAALDQYRLDVGSYPAAALRGVGVTSNTFRIEGEGWVMEARKARIVAVVQRRSPSPSSAATDPLTALGLTILSWRMGETQ